MIVSVVPIGNSKGIRIPKSIIDEFGIEDAMELKIRENEILLKPIGKKPRQGWGEAFKTMHERADDILLIPDAIDADAFGWEW
jgi:antitoxin MazE